MATTNHDRVGKALDLLKDGLRPFVERELKAQHAQQWLVQVRDAVGPAQEKLFEKAGETPPWDAASLLAVMWNQWNLVFKKTLGQAERTLVSELRDVRNAWAHQKTFSGDDAYRALDSVGRLLAAVSAPEAGEIEKMRMELLRVRFDEQARTERRKSAGTAVESVVTGALKPWREVVQPHQDVASGRFSQAEFAADLWQVHKGEGSDEYRDPVEFFRRTFLTGSLKQLLTGAARRLSGLAADPVVQLQTNFGGGKTHSMLALYHLFSKAKAESLVGAESVLADAGVERLPTVKIVVLVGNKISPGSPELKADGTTVHTLWGEIAWQLGGKKAYERFRLDDERGTSPGDKLRELFNEHAPCLILIDEWVAYARQLHEAADLPGGSFETHFTFAQLLTESAKTAERCLLVVSLPASDGGTSPHSRVEDVEVGGERGRAALDRLRNAIGRVDSAWRPASAEEGFEIVRRRLFAPITEREQFVERDNIAKAFYGLYRSQQQEFPSQARESGYEKRLRDAYPIHPEVFDRLYDDWSTLVKFQRTRGVLRLMAAVIHSLWEKGDRNPLILPGNIPIDDPRVQFELTRYLSDNWPPILEKDVDGPNALPRRIDAEVPNLGRYAATRRVARTIYLGSAPKSSAAHQGIEDARIKLGCVMPGEQPALFGDALRRLSDQATYLYQDGGRYWYSTQPTVTKLAEDRANDLLREPEKVAEEIERHVKANLRAKGDFERIHAFPKSGVDVQDDREARLVVLGPDSSHVKEGASEAIEAAKRIFESRGVAPRIYRNSLVFLAPDRNRLQELDEAVRKLMAWESIVAQVEELNLTPHQEKQAIHQRDSAQRTVEGRLPETFQWLIVPTQSSPQSEIKWEAMRLTGADPLAVRARRKLRNDELLLDTLAGSRLRLELDKVPLWREDQDHVSIRQLAEYYGQFVYLQRIASSETLSGAIESGVNLTSWEIDGFAYADSFDEATGRYRALRAGERVTVREGDSGVVVKPTAARRQFDSERASAVGRREEGSTESGDGLPSPGVPPSPPEKRPQPTRYFATVRLDPNRVGRDAARVGEEVLAHLTALDGADVNVVLEIGATIREGVPENVVRIVSENGRTLKFTSQGFEAE